ncbi:hypothetical protein [Ramlibacter albus]|uniref:Lipoprotein n=1 Tax=Ramlibacter albus TaxID=2079448 RepID=A0A923MDS8_9BURK|nr:hypothetical protein [Ramlibacter albus]MBC5768301.1 hypothetical protein [Ramlibacter albus]
MNDLLERFLRAGLLAVSLVLAACGPGSGGTGTGPIATQFFSATSTVTGPAGGIVGGAVGASARVDLQLQNTSVELTTDCGRFVFTGEWSANAGSTVVLPGRFERTNSSTVASLRLQFSDGLSDSRAVTVTLLDASGNVLLGPVTLNRADTLAPRPATGCN